MLSLGDIEDECCIVSESGDSAAIEVINNPSGQNRVIANQISGDAPNPGRADIQVDSDALIAWWAVDEYDEERVKWRIKRVK